MTQVYFEKQRRARIRAQRGKKEVMVGEEASPNVQTLPMSRIGHENIPLDTGQDRGGERPAIDRLANG